MARLILSSAALAILREACERRYPEEACGLLLGTAGSARRVTEIVVARNLDASAERFTLDPADFVRADSQARDSGLEILGMFHSHPDRAPRPSRADEGNAQPGWSHVIACVRGDGARGRVSDLRSWALRQDDAAPGLAEEALEWADPWSAPGSQ